MFYGFQSQLTTINDNSLHQRHVLNEKFVKLNMDSGLDYIPHELQEMAGINYENLNKISQNWGQVGFKNSYPNHSHLSKKQCCKENLPYEPSIKVWNLNRMLRKVGIRCIPNQFLTKMWCVQDYGGYVAAGFTWILIFVGFSLIIFISHSLANSSTLSLMNCFLATSFALLAFLSHCMAMFSDPGVVPRGSATDENIKKMMQVKESSITKCVKCDSIKPQRAHHCRVCKRCIRKMDHHCPWINNCVGELNQKQFILFTFYVFLLSVDGFFTALFQFIRLFQITNQSSDLLNFPILISSLVLLVESSMFGLFTLIMTSTQLHSLCYDTTSIESLKKDERQKNSCQKSFQEVFGGKMSIKWLSPFHPSIFSPLFPFLEFSMESDSSISGYYYQKDSNVIDF